MRGLVGAMLAVEGVRQAQERFGKGKVMTGEQARWGYENLNLTQAKLDALGFKGVMRPVSTSCADHMGAAWARMHTWDGSKWSSAVDWMQADEQIIKPMVKAAADKYAAEKKLDTPHLRIASLDLKGHACRASGRWSAAGPAFASSEPPMPGPCVQRFHLA
jgi:branched-chain amino acid transport system substrate-binding protein